jgi:general secretion pathway protein G
MKLKNEKGFTLIELLVVIAIISILTIVLSANFVSAQMKSRDVKRKADLNSLAKALQMFYTDYGHFPDQTAHSSEPNIQNLLDAGGEFSYNGYVYMKDPPKETKNNWPSYVYRVSGDGKSFNLYADLENKKDSECRSGQDGKPAPFSVNLGGTGTNYCYGISSPNVPPGTLL